MRGIAKSTIIFLDPLYGLIYNHFDRLSGLGPSFYERGNGMNDRDQIRVILEEIVKKIVIGYSPLKIILFGSYAYGMPTEDSDIDLLIIKETDKRPIDRWMEVKRLLRDRNRDVSVSPLVYTSKELSERVTLRDFFIQEVLEKGKVLYG